MSLNLLNNHTVFSPHHSSTIALVATAFNWHWFPKVNTVISSFTKVQNDVNIEKNAMIWHISLQNKMYNNSFSCHPKLHHFFALFFVKIFKFKLNKWLIWDIAQQIDFLVDKMRKWQKSFSFWRWNWANFFHIWFLKCLKIALKKKRNSKLQFNMIHGHPKKVVKRFLYERLLSQLKYSFGLTTVTTSFYSKALCISAKNEIPAIGFLLFVHGIINQITNKSCIWCHHGKKTIKLYRALSWELSTSTWNGMKLSLTMYRKCWPIVWRVTKKNYKTCHWPKKSKSDSKFQFNHSECNAPKWIL